MTRRLRKIAVVVGLLAAIVVAVAVVPSAAQAAISLVPPIY